MKNKIFACIGFVKLAGTGSEIVPVNVDTLVKKRFTQQAQIQNIDMEFENPARCARNGSYFYSGPSFVIETSAGGENRERAAFNISDLIEGRKIELPEWLLVNALPAAAPSPSNDNPKESSLSWTAIGLVAAGIVVGGIVWAAQNHGGASPQSPSAAVPVLSVPSPQPSTPPPASSTLVHGQSY